MDSYSPWIPIHCYAALCSVVCGPFDHFEIRISILKFVLTQFQSDQTDHVLRSSGYELYSPLRDRATAESLGKKMVRTIATRS
jgi:hypothetical protein